MFSFNKLTINKLKIIDKKVCTLFVIFRYRPGFGPNSSNYL